MPNLGNINLVYQGDLNDRGDTASSPGPQAMYSYLLGQGATKGEAMMLTGAAASESDFDPDAHHDHGVGYGMFGHNGSRLMQMRQFAQQQGTSIGDWRTQASFALNELRSRPEGAAAANATSPEQLALAQMHYEQPQGFTSSDPTAGHNYLGRLNTLRRFTQLDPNATGAFAPSNNPQVAPSQGADVGLRGFAGSPMAMGGVPDLAGAGVVARGGSGASNPFSQVGNPQLNAALAQALAQYRPPLPQAQKPLVTQLLGAAVSPLRQGLASGLSSLLGGLSAPGAADGMSTPSASAALSSPSAAPPAADQSPSLGSGLSSDPPMPVPRPPEFGGNVQMAGLAPIGGGASAPLFSLAGMFGG